MQGNEVVRMVPFKDGKANHGHSCVKGRFAWGYTSHKDRILNPMIRKNITDPWQEVSWEEAIAYTASEFKRIQKEYGPDAIGGITSSRCTNEETFLVQKLVRAAFGNNNVDTCARVCHSPTGYGLKTTLGTSAGTNDFDSVDSADVLMVIGSNPTDAHPVFASHMKRRLREGAHLIVVDPRRIDLVKLPHVAGGLPPAATARHQRRRHQRAWPTSLSRRAWSTKSTCASAATSTLSRPLGAVRLRGAPLSGGGRRGNGRSGRRFARAARLYATGGNGAIYYGLGVTEHSQGSTMVMGMANLAMATGNFGKPGTGVNPMRGQNNVQGSCDMGSFPHEFAGYRHVSDDSVRAIFEEAWQVGLQGEPGLRIPNMFDAALDGYFKGMYIQGEDIVQSDPNTKHVAAGLSAMECIVVQDLFLNETASYAHVFLPGSTFLEKDGTFTNAERRLGRVRKMYPAEERLRGLGDHAAPLERHGLRDALRPPVRDHGRDRPPDADFRRRDATRSWTSSAACSGP